MIDCKLDLILTDIPRHMHLDVGGTIMGTMKEANLPSYIDSLLPKTSNNQKLTHGEIISMLLVSLSTREPLPLSYMPAFAYSVPMNFWLENERVAATDLNRFAIAASCKAIAEFGPSRFLSLAVDKMLGQFDLSKIRVFNFDSSSFHHHGRYKVYSPLADPKVLARIEEGEARLPEDSADIEVKHGYSRDNRPQDRQINLVMATFMIPGTDVAVPAAAYSYSGHINDISSFPEFVTNCGPRLKRLCQNLEYGVCDSAGATFKTAKAIQDLGLKLITRLPDGNKSSKQAYQKAKDGDLEWQLFDLSCDEAGDDPVTVNVAKVGTHTFKNRQNKGEPGITGQLLLVDAEPMRTLKTQTVNHNADKELKHITAELNGIATACLPDAQKQVDKVLKGLKYCTVSQVEYHEELHYNKKGRPKKGAQPNCSEFHVTAVVERNDKAIAEAIDQELRYVLWCSDIDADPWTIYSNYHQQSDVEGCWRSLKDPLGFIGSFNVKKTKHMAALSALMVLALLIQRLTLIKFRQFCQQSGLAVPRVSSNRPTLTPSWTTVQRAFNLAGISYDLVGLSVSAPKNSLSSLAFRFLEQSSKWIRGMYCAQNLNQYVDAIKRSHVKFRAWLDKLTKQEPECWNSVNRRPRLKGGAENPI